MNKLITKYKKQILIAVILTVFLAPGLILAESEGSLLERAGKAAGYNVDEQGDETAMARVVGSVAQIFISIIGVIFICYTIYGGFLYMTASGNEEKTTKAKAIIRDGIIGIIIILASAAIYFLIRNALISGGGGGGGTGTAL